MSSTFARSVLNSKNKVKIHGVTRTDDCGIPKCVIQTEFPNSQIADEHQNAVKAAVLEGDSIIKDLVAISLYDSQPVYFLSSVILYVKWTQFWKKVYGKKLDRKETLPFLRPNFVDDYNNDMNPVDRADQLRTSYNVGYGSRQRKWWWLIFLWDIDVVIINSHLLYKSWYEMHGLKPMNHYHFQEKITLAWLGKDQFWCTR